MQIAFNSIGIIHTPFNNVEGMPIQSRGAKGIEGQIELFPEYLDGLKDLEGFSHIILLYYFHKVKGYKLLPIPFLDTKERGLFATRSPKRPNPIGMSVVQLVKIEKNILHVINVEMLNQTPLLDIKPYVPEFDAFTNTKTGWLEKAKGEVINKRSDDRFK